jgi:AcrR family transcriptional regulator
MAKLSCEQGFAGVTVAALCQEADVSRACFYELFANRQMCFLAVLDEGYARVSALVSAAFEQTGDWLQGGRLALAELLLFFDSEPELARVCLVGSLAAGPWALEHRERYVISLTQLIVSHLGSMAPSEPHPHTNAGVMASMMGIVQNHLLAGHEEPLIGLLGPLVGLGISPYLDSNDVAEEVRRAGVLAQELKKAPTLAFPRSGRQDQIPEILLNPRARRARECVLYLAEHPGASNGQIARAIGVSSHTQISTLLGRLQRAGVILKCPGSPGFPNAWTLTSAGEDAARAAR